MRIRILPDSIRSLPGFRAIRVSEYLMRMGEAVREANGHWRIGSPRMDGQTTPQQEQQIGAQDYTTP